MENHAFVFGSSWVIRLGIKHVLRRVSVSVLAEADTFEQINAVRLKETPVLIINIANHPFERERLLADARAARLLYPSVPQAIIAAKMTSELLADGLEAGADGFLSLAMPSKLLLSSIQLLLHGQKLYPSLPQTLPAESYSSDRFEATVIEPNFNTAQPSYAPPPGQRFGGDRIDLPPVLDRTPCGPALVAEPSEREWEILRCLASGGSNKAIARELGIAETTVKVHVKSVLRKLHLSNRTQAAVWMLNQDRCRSVIRLDREPMRRAMG